MGVDKLAEILIFRQKYPMLTEGDVHDYAIVRTRRDFCHGKHVMADSPERSNHREVATLVGEELHGLALGSFAGRSTNQHRFLVSHSVGGIANGSLDIGLGEPGIGIKQISLGGPLSEFRRISSTGIRVPRMTGLPIITLGFTSIRCLVMSCPPSVK